MRGVGLSFAASLLPTTLFVQPPIRPCTCTNDAAAAAGDDDDDARHSSVL